jgi:hypothetical protein
MLSKPRHAEAFAKPFGGEWLPAKPIRQSERVCSERTQGAERQNGRPREGAAIRVYTLPALRSRSYAAAATVESVFVRSQDHGDQIERWAVQRQYRQSKPGPRLIRQFLALPRRPYRPRSPTGS